MKNYMVAITGGIGSGKSTVCKIIKEKGYPVFSCDEIYKRLIEKEEVVLRVSEICSVAPLETEKGVKLAKKAIADKIFTDRKLKAKLEEYTHPLIMNELISSAKKQGGITFSEVPLLFEGGFETLFDKVIIVTRDLNQRIAAVCKRDGTTKKEVENRIKNQTDYENIQKDGHTVLYNDGDLTSLENKTVELLSEIKKEIC